MRPDKIITLLVAVLLLCAGCAALAETPEVPVLQYKRFSAPADAETIDLGRSTVDRDDTEKFLAFLAGFPNLKKVDMFESWVSEEQINAMLAAFPDVEFGWTMRVMGYHVRTDDTSFSTRHGNGSSRYDIDCFRLLKYCKNLKALDLGHNRINDLSLLDELPSLKVLILADNQITDLTAIARHTELEYLELFRNRITDFSPLTALTKLKDLNVVYNYAEDLSPFFEMTSLERLWMNNYNSYKPTTPMDTETIEKLRIALPDTLIDTTAKSPTGNWWRDHPRYDVIQEMFRKGGQYAPFADSEP